VISAPAFSANSTFVLSLVCMALIPLVALGLALINTGLGRSRSAAHTMLYSLCVFSDSHGKAQSGVRLTPS
jgi:hypothetical protein